MFQQKSIKSDASVTLVRVEYNGAVLGDSCQTQVLPDGTANYNFTTSFECSPSGPNSLDSIVQNLVLCKYLTLNLPPWRWVLSAAPPCLPAAGVTRSRIALQQQCWRGGLSTSVPISASWKSPLSCWTVLLGFTFLVSFEEMKNEHVPELTQTLCSP